MINLYLSTVLCLKHQCLTVSRMNCDHYYYFFYFILIVEQRLLERIR